MKNNCFFSLFFVIFSALIVFQTFHLLLHMDKSGGNHVHYQILIPTKKKLSNMYLCLSSWFVRCSSYSIWLLIQALGIRGYVSCRYMVVFQYGSAVLFNIEDPEVERYLEMVRRHTSGLLTEMRKDGIFLWEDPNLVHGFIFLSFSKFCWVSSIICYLTNKNRIQEWYLVLTLISSFIRLCHKRETTSGWGYAGRPGLYCPQNLRYW